MKALSIFPAKVWLLALLSAFGCAHNNPVIEGQEITSQASLRPIDIEPSIAEKIGHEALQKVGYEEIIRLAEKAGFVAYKSDISIQLVSYGSAVASGFVPVFSRYAAAAAVTSQADSPLPGPADVAAVGVIVIGLVDAGLLDGYLLNTVGALLLGARDKLLMSKAKTNEAKGTGGTTAAPGAERAGGETKAESADTTDPAADAEAGAKGGESTVKEGAVRPAAAKVLQTGGNKMNPDTARGLNEALGQNLSRREWGRALEALKKDRLLPNDFHGRILSTGEYVNPHTGESLGNLLWYTP